MKELFHVSSCYRIQIPILRAYHRMEFFVSIDIGPVSLSSWINMLANFDAFRLKKMFECKKFGLNFIWFSMYQMLPHENLNNFIRFVGGNTKVQHEDKLKVKHKNYLFEHCGFSFLVTVDFIHGTRCSIWSSFGDRNIQ